MEVMVAVQSGTLLHALRVQLKRRVSARRGIFPVARKCPVPGKNTAAQELELELELIQTQMTQKPMLRAEVYAHDLRASQNRK